jgi:hypothetical protein
MVEFEVLEGPLDSSRLGRVADLYGPVDAKYRDPAQLRHLFASAPGGPALHAFALDATRPVGHCAVVPMPARKGGAGFLAGKVEALVVDEAYRGRRGASPPVAVKLREALYAAADAKGIELLHAYVRPPVGRILELAPVRIAPPSFVAVIRAETLATSRLRAPAVALSLAQRSARALARPFVGSPSVRMRTPAAGDQDLVQAPTPPEDRWTVLAEDTWEWYVGAPSLRVLELERGTRVLLQLPGSAGDALRLVAWRAERPSVASALRALVASAQVASDTGASTVRYQPWPAGFGEAALARACRVLGFVTRDDFATLYVRAKDPALARPEAIVSTPLLALGF